jgi:maltokinase
MSNGYEEHLHAYLSEQRWFAGKERSFEVAAIEPLSWLSDDPPARIELATVRYDDGSQEVYQIPVAYLPDAVPELGHALIGAADVERLGSATVYDATYVDAATSALLLGFLQARHDTDLDFRTLAGAELPPESAVGSVMTVEQSNTSIAYGEDAVLKLFRRVAPGTNPDVEITAALTERGDEHVPRLLGWLEARWRSAEGREEHGQLAMLQQFLRTATDGWDIALASVRDLFVEEDLHPEEVGGDFASEAERLGSATAEVHRDLAAAFGTSELSSTAHKRLVDGMRERLEAALHVAPELADVSTAIGTAYDQFADSAADVTVQRIHGDLHLGQTLRTVKGWKIIDFEGEPAKTLAERTAVDSPLRDVAGMLRSFDYAAGVTLLHFGYADHLRYRGDEWSARNRAAFLDGYAAGTGTDPGEHKALLRAYEIDKAVYEVVYEARHRPHWLSLPLHGLERLAAQDCG